MYHVPRSGLSLLSTVAWFTDFFFFCGYESTINTYVTKSTLLFYTFYKHRINFIIANCITFRTVFFLLACLHVYLHPYVLVILLLLSRSQTPIFSLLHISSPLKTKVGAHSLALQPLKSATHSLQLSELVPVLTPSVVTSRRIIPESTWRFCSSDLVNSDSNRISLCAFVN